MDRSSMFCCSSVLVVCFLMNVVQPVGSEGMAKKIGGSGGRGASSERMKVPEAKKMNSTNGPSMASHNQSRIPVYLSPDRNQMKRSNNSSAVGCKELRSKRFISDGYCRSLRPMTEVVCSGHCLPVRDLPWYTDIIRTWGRTGSFEWRCVDGLVHKRKITLTCDDGTSKVYRVKAVRNCVCQRVARPRDDVFEERGVAVKKHGKKNEKRQQAKRKVP